MLKQNLLFAMVVALPFSCERRCECAPSPLSPLVGEWQLTRITYGLTQKTVTAAEAGYTETLSFTNGGPSGGTYRQTRNGLPVNSGSYSVSGSDTQGLIFYQNDTTQQSFRRETEKTLLLSERGARGVTIADGSTYEYQRQ